MEWGTDHAWLIAQLVAVGAFAVLTYRKGMLTGPGALTAFLMGAAIIVQTNIFWLLLLFALLGLASATTRFKYSEKEERAVAEKRGGRRGVRNVIANGLTPALVALLSPAIAAQWGWEAAAIAFASGIAVSAADTVASEIGSLADRVYLITTLKPVPPGTDGGVSPEGQVAALAGAAATAVLALAFLGPLTAGPYPLTLVGFAIPVATGFLGCQVDSLLGATLEIGGLVTKEEVNLVSITAGAVVGLALAVALA